MAAHHASPVTGPRELPGDDLAVLADISRAALYQMFNSKDQVFRRICSDLVEGLISEIREGLGTLPDPGQKIRFAVVRKCGSDA